MSGRFIIVEGGEGSGKSTLLRTLAAHLAEENVAVLATREPGGTPWGEKVRNLLLTKNKELGMMRPATQLMGHYMARMQHLEECILPALSRGTVVLCDRFEISSLVYQVYAQKVGSTATDLFHLFLALHSHVTKLLLPYRCQYVICDIDPQEGLERVALRNEVKTVFDEMSLAFHERVREGMLHARSVINPHFKVFVLDASEPPEVMLATMRRLVAV